MTPLLPSLVPLDDQALLAELPRLARSERAATVALVARLAELDARRLYLAAGFSSLFAYCTSALRLSEGEAFNRIYAARAVRRFPELLDRLLDGSLSLTTLRLVAPHLSDGDKELLEAAAGKSKRQVEELVVAVARLPEQPAVSSVRKLPDLAKPTASLPPSRRPVVAPVSTNQYRITITVSREMRDELSRVQNLLRHQIPDGDPGKILARALSAHRQQLERKKLGAGQGGRAGRHGRAHATFLPRFGARSGNGTEAAARSSPGTGGAAPSAVAWSSITSTRTPWEARRRCETSRSAAGPITPTRPWPGSDPESRFGNSFRNDSNLGPHSEAQGADSLSSTKRNR